MSPSDEAPAGALRARIPLLPAEPLCRRVPARDAAGRAYGDFMMLIPGLRTQPPHVVQATLRELELALGGLAGMVVFADFNLRLNLLWVTVAPGRDIAPRVAAAIQARVPQAKRVAAQLSHV